MVAGDLITSVSLRVAVADDQYWEGVATAVAAAAAPVVSSPASADQSSGARSRNFHAAWENSSFTKRTDSSSLFSFSLPLIDIPEAVQSSTASLMDCSTSLHLR